jgi:hypothetical protein
MRIPNGSVIKLSPDWMQTRLVVVATAISGPIYFFLLMYILPFTLSPFTEPLFNELFHHVITPLVFSAPWLGIIYNSRYRFANTVHHMHDSTSSVPLRWRVFYGTNAAFVLAFFVLPIVTPPLAIIGGLYVAGVVFYRVGVGKLGGGKLASALAVLIAIALCILPTIILLQFIPEYVLVWQEILGAWSSFWVKVVYGIAQCLVNALSFGAPVYFLYFAAQEYDRGVYGEVYTATPTKWIRIAEAIIFFIFISLYLPPVPTPIGTLPFLDRSDLFNQYVNWISLGVVVILTLVKKLLGVENDTTLGGPSNIVIVGMFLVVELFFKTDLLIVTLIIWLAFLLYASVFIANFLRASPREMY